MSYHKHLAGQRVGQVGHRRVAIRTAVSVIGGLALRAVAGPVATSPVETDHGITGCSSVRHHISEGDRGCPSASKVPVYSLLEAPTWLKHTNTQVDTVTLRLFPGS